MLKIILLTVLIIAFSMAFMCIRILFKKNGRFPNTHVSGNKYMRSKGIGCVQSQDYAARHQRGGIQERVTE